MRPARIATLALVASACAAALGPAVHEWAESAPVVPHDTFPADCGLCHVGEGWTELRADFAFDHGARTGVPLAGAHERAQCLFCHNDTGPVAEFAARGCAGCHEDPHQQRFGATCADCHTESDWEVPEIVAQHDRAGFPLVGSHLATACFQCHARAEAGIFTPLARACETCHAADLARATDPDHASLGWTSGCRDCHAPFGWSGAGFLHDGFPLTGAHRQADCALCHTNGVFSGTPDQCADCHLADYQGTTDPDHSGLGFSLSCELCHTTVDWEGAFSHQGIVDGCVACHQADYDATTDPAHAAAGFSTDCETCHGTNQWEGAVFLHVFPIDGGPHAPLDCSDCHTPSAPAPAFSCTHCHEHSESQTADDHDEVAGYVWESNACRDCHPKGTKDLLLLPPSAEPPWQRARGRRAGAANRGPVGGPETPAPGKPPVRPPPGTGTPPPR